jgi:hypothetical protein
MFAIWAEMNGAFLESIANAQKDWSDFVHRCIKEDVAVGRRLMQSKSVADMHRVYAEYFSNTFEQYQEQSRRSSSAGRPWLNIWRRPRRTRNRRGPDTTGEIQMMDDRTTMRELVEVIARSRSATEREAKLVAAVPKCSARTRRQRALEMLRDHLSTARSAESRRGQQDQLRPTSAHKLECTPSGGQVRR